MAEGSQVEKRKKARRGAQIRRLLRYSHDGARIREIEWVDTKFLQR